MRQHKWYYKAMHWVMALAVFGAVGIALSLDDIPLGPTKILLINWHKWLGGTVLMLVVFRLFAMWKGYQPLVEKSWDNVLAKITHWALYVGMVATPLTGIAMSQAAGYPVVWFGVLPIPQLPITEWMSDDDWRDYHEFFAWFFVALIALHVAGAIKRQFTKEKVITQMIK